jgi:RNA polymerase sigma factor (TIGR02999 family)
VLGYRSNVSLQVRVTDSESITRLLSEWSNGDRAALDRLTPAVYHQLHTLARTYLLRNRGSHTLQPTAVISELYVRLIDQAAVQWNSRAHFFGIAARLMRQILVDHVRSQRAAKRGGNAMPVTLNDAHALSPESRAPDVLDLDRALSRLAEFDGRKSDIVEFRYFGGMTREEIASALGVSVGTVKRDLSLAEAWLRRELTRKS